MLTPAQVAALPDAIVDVVRAMDTAISVQGAKYAVDLYADRARMVALGSGFQREVADAVAEAVRAAVTTANAAPEALYAAAETAGKLGPYAPLADSIAVRAIVNTFPARASTAAETMVRASACARRTAVLTMARTAILSASGA